MARIPPVPHNTPLQEQGAQRLTQPWLQWLEVLRTGVNTAIGGGSGVSDHDDLTNVTANQHHAEVHTHPSSLTYGDAVSLVTYGLTPTNGVLQSVSRSDHSHGSVPILRPWWMGKKLFWAYPEGSILPIEIRSGAGNAQTRTTAGGTIVDQSDSFQLYGSVSSNVSGTRCGFAIGVSPEQLFPGGMSSDPFEYNPYVFTRLKLKAITNLRFHWIIGNNTLSNTDSPWGASTTNGGLAFSFLPSTSANWLIQGKVYSSASVAFTYNTLIPVLADTAYNLEMSIVGSGSTRTARFYINGVLVYTETGTTNYSINTGGIAYSSTIFSLYPTENVIKQFGIASTLWGANANPHYTGIMPGFVNWVSPDIFPG